MHHLKPLNVLFPRIGGGLSMARVIVMESLFLICIATHFTIYTKHNCSVFRWVWVFEIDFFSEFDLSRSSVQLDWQKKQFHKTVVGGKAVPHNTIRSRLKPRCMRPNGIQIKITS
eukprot:128449_1